MRPAPGMGTPTPVGIPNGVHPLPHQMPTPTPIEFRIHDMNRRFYLFLNTGVSISELIKDHSKFKKYITIRKSIV